MRDQNEFQTRGDKDGTSTPAGTATKERKKIVLGHQVAGSAIEILDLLLRVVPDSGEVGKIKFPRRKRRNGKGEED